MSFAPIQLIQSAVNKNVWAFLDDSHDKYISGCFYLGAASTLPLDTELFGETCILFHKAERNVYLNVANDAVTPNWQLIAGSGVPVFPFLLAKGDLLTHDGSTTVILPVGPAGYILTADPAAPDGIDWKPLTLTPPSVVTVSTGTTGFVQAPSLTWSHDSIGTNRLLLVQVQTEEIETITGVTYNGIALTQGPVTTDLANNLRTEQWYLIAPPVGTYNIVVSMSAPAYITGEAETLNSVDQTAPIGSIGTGSGNSALAAVLVNTIYDYSLVIDSVGTAGPGIAMTPGAGQTTNAIEVAATREGISTAEAAGSAPDAVTMSVILAPATDWVQNAVEVRGIAAGALTDEKVKVSASDTNPDFLANKVAAGPNITLQILNIGGNEMLEITAAASGGGSFTVDQTPDNGTYGLLAGAVDGINTTFTVSQSAYQTGKLQVFLNGLIQLQGAADDFVETTPGSGTFDFVTPPLAGDIITVVYPAAGSGGSGTALEFTVNQTAHGFSVGDVIRPSGTDNEFTTSQANTAVNSEAVGIVTVVINANNFTYVSSAIQLSGAFVPVAPSNTTVWLDPNVAGGMTTTEPTAVGQIKRGLGTIIASGATMYFDIAALAEEITSSSGGGIIPSSSEKIRYPVLLASGDFTDAPVRISNDGLYMYVFDRANLIMYRMDKQPNGNWAYQGLNYTIAGAFPAPYYTIVDGGDGIYVFSYATTTLCFRLDYNLTTETAITGFTTTTSNGRGCVYWRAGFFYVTDYSAITTFAGVKKYTVTGTVATLSSTTTFPISFTTQIYMQVDENENYLFTELFGGNEYRLYDSAGAFVQTQDFVFDNGTATMVVAKSQFQYSDTPVMALSFYLSEGAIEMQYVEFASYNI